MADHNHQAGIMRVSFCSQHVQLYYDHRPYFWHLLTFVGSRHSVGIFFWTTNSEMDNRISGGPWLSNATRPTFEAWNSTALVASS